jgi:hypothetical protein
MPNDPYKGQVSYGWAGRPVPRVERQGRCSCCGFPVAWDESVAEPLTPVQACRKGCADHVRIEGEDSGREIARLTAHLAIKQEMLDFIRAKVDKVTAERDHYQRLALGNMALTRAVVHRHYRIGDRCTCKQFARDCPDRIAMQQADPDRYRAIVEEKLHHDRLMEQIASPRQRGGPLMHHTETPGMTRPLPPPLAEE